MTIKPKVSATGTVTRFGEWQPIETAPRDGFRVLAYAGDDFELAWWSEYSQSWKSYCTGDRLNPTHWMPIPPLP